MCHRLFFVEEDEDYRELYQNNRRCCLEKEMKLLVVSQYFWPENFRINDICDGLVERGHSVDVLTSLPNVPQGRFYDGYGWFKRGPKEHKGIGIERVGVIRRGSGGGLRWMLNCASFAVNSLFHLPKLRKNDYDAVFVFANSPVTKILPAKRFAKVKKIPNVIFILDIWPESMFFLLGMKEKGKETFFKKTSRAVSRWLYRSGDLLLVSSKGFEGKLRDMGLDNEIAYFPNYAEPFKLEKNDDISRKKLGLLKEDFVVGFAGNVGRAQGLDKLIEAAAENRNGGIKYLIVGDGSELDDIKLRCAGSRLTDRFVFTGWVDSAVVPNYLDLCDVLLVSLEDSGVLNLTVPAKLQTYMHAAKPVIAFLNGAGAEVVRKARCGATAAAGDAEALREAIDGIAACPKAVLEQAGRNGQVYCGEHYDREKVLDSLVDYIEDAIKDYVPIKQKRNKMPRSNQQLPEAEHTKEE